MKKAFIITASDSDTEELLTKQGAQELVRCEQCANGKQASDEGYILCKGQVRREKDWFCADGKRRKEIAVFFLEEDFDTILKWTEFSGAQTIQEAVMDAVNRAF